VMPNISRGDRMDGLTRYLVGPGRQDEHEHPHLVGGSPSLMAWWSDQTLSVDDALAIAKELDQPHQVYGTEPYGGHVWHCSLALRAEEGELGDEKWGEIAEEFMGHMGFLADGKAPVRWAGFHHGLTVSGNDHIHLAVSLVREDGTKASTWNDRPRAQAACRAIEQKFGLEVVESRGIGMGERGRKPHAMPRPAEKGRPRPQVAETYDERLERFTRAVAATTGSEAEFVRGMRKMGLLMRPRFADGGETIVEGWSVAARPPKGQRPQFRAGGKLARDLTIQRLREAHWPADPNDPAGAARAAMEAAAAWRSARRNRRIGPDTGPAIAPELDQRYAQEVANLRERLRTVAPGDVGTWSAVAHQLSGAFSAWSLAAEGETPGPLARTAATLSRTAQVHRQPGAQPVHNTWGPSIRGVSLILASAARGGRGPVGVAVLLRQLANTAKALHDAHAAADLAQEAHRISMAVLTDLDVVRRSLPSPELRQRAEQRAAEAGQLVGGGRPVPPGSPVPAHLQARRTVQQPGGAER